MGKAFDDHFSSPDNRERRAAYVMKLGTISSRVELHLCFIGLWGV